MTWEIREGDCIESMRAMPDDSIDAVVCDPPYGIGFMGHAWDQPGAEHAPIALNGKPQPFAASTDRKRRRERHPSASSGAGHARDRAAAAAGEPPKPDAMQAGRYDLSATANQRFQAWCEAWATEALRVLKPGGHLLASGGTRTSHRLAAGIEDAGFAIRDSLIWIYGSGFPKSLDVSKAIDKAAGAEREVVAEKTSPDGTPYSARHGDRSGRRGGIAGDPVPVSLTAEVVTAPATSEAEQWDGWGTALKPGHEPIVVARKPLIGTVAANVLEHGTGALNIDGCRIPGTARAFGNGSSRHGGQLGGGGVGKARGEWVPTADGRWPANLILSHAEDCVCVDERKVKASDPRRADGTVNGSLGTNGVLGGANSAGMDKPFYADEDGLETVEAWECAPGCPVAALDAQSGTLRSGTAVGGLRRMSNKHTSVYGQFAGMRTEGDVTYGDTGGASRFFYCAKASRAERNAGLSGFDEAMPDNAVDRSSRREGGETAPGRGSLSGPRANVHPTVKPVELMRWLVRLVTPPGGTVLDPFTGSGTTGCAAVLEGFDFIGCERQGPEWKREHPEADDYVAIASVRIAWWSEHPEAVETSRVFAAEKLRAETAAAGQGGLF